jgi:hypothetical protein
MGLKEELEKLKEAHVSDTKDTVEVEEEKDSLTFEGFKALVREKLNEDKILKQMRLSWHEDAHTMLIFQGVMSNSVARLRSNGVHVINRSVVKKRLQEVLDLEIHQ